jgi:L-fuconolactonase
VIVDAQIHVWSAERADRPWPSDGHLRAHALEFRDADALLAMDSVGVSAAVLVPPSFEGDYNDVVADAVHEHPARFLAMGRLTTQTPRSCADLGRIMRVHNLAGFRVMITSLSKATMRSGDLDWLWTACSELRIPLMLSAAGLAQELLHLARRFPELRFAVDHLGLAKTTMPPEVAGSVDQLSVLADMPNVAVKASALPYYTNESPPFPAALSLIETVVSRFGAERVFWGSDLTRLPCLYQEWVRAVAEGPLDITDDQRWLVLGDALLDWFGAERTAPLRGQRDGGDR